MTRTQKLFMGLVLLFFWSCSLEDSISESNFVTGLVTTTAGDPISGATIELVTSKDRFTTQTDNTGKYRLSNIRTGLGTLFFNYADFYEAKRQVVIGMEKELTVDVVLQNFMDTYYLVCMPENITLENFETQKTFHVSTNAGFSVSSPEDWIKVSPGHAAESAVITLTCEQNETSTSRSGTVTIKGDYGKILTIPVMQKAGPVFKLLSMETTEYLPEVNRNGAVFRFNRRVAEAHIETKNSNYIENVKTNISADGLTVTFTGFAQDDPFDEPEYRLFATDEDGTTLTASFTVRSYLYKHPQIETGYPENFLILPGGDYCWDMYNQMKLYKFPEMKYVTAMADQYVYFALTYTTFNNSIIGFRTKPSGKYYADIYDASTGKLVSEKEFVFSYSGHVAGAAVSAEGVVLFCASDELLVMDLTDELPEAKKLEDAQAVFAWPFPEKLTTINNGKTFLFYSERDFEEVYTIDGKSMKINKVTLPVETGSYGFHLKPYALQSLNLLVIANDETWLMNLETNVGRLISNSQPTSVQLVEKDNVLTHVLMTEYPSGISIYSVDKNIETKIKTPDGHSRFIASSYTSDYVFMAVEEYQTYGSIVSYYVFEADVFIQTATKP